ncbi:MAG: hypothetical protein ACSLE5_01590 [Porticoccaceae bacterium]
MALAVVLRKSTVKARMPNRTRALLAQPAHPLAPSRNTQSNYAMLADFIGSFRLAVKQAIETGIVQLDSVQGLAAINAEVTRQATMLAYLQDFRLMMWVSLVSMPLIFLLKAPPQTRMPAAKAVVAE